jgi:hypothetical protein
VQGSRIALDGTALVAFLADAKGTGKVLQPLMQGIAQGTVRQPAAMAAAPGTATRCDRRHRTGHRHRH